MRRLWAISAVFFLLTSLFLGCNRRAKNNDGDKPDPIIDPAVKIVPRKDGDKAKKDVPPTQTAADAARQEKYEAALADALIAQANRKWTEALTAFETARSLQDTDFVKAEITRLKQRIDQDGAAKKTLKNIEVVLNDGNADDAAVLANDALKELGAGDDADQLIALRLQAEAIRNAEKKEPNDARYTRFKKEGESAVAEQNLRAAALAFEQALLAREDADLQQTYDAIRAKLDQYDALRKKAAELRANAQQLDDALAALNDAKAAWDTLQIRQEIDDCTLARQKRREAVSVADFEVRNDVGMADAGANIAEELLPRLKSRYDLVERGQLRRVVAELKLEQGFGDDPKQQQQIGKLANVRYLVVGSVQRLVGVTVRARLVDVQTGLVVQTGKINAPSMAEAINLIPDLAKQLLATDDQAVADQQNAGNPVDVVPVNAVLPAVPMLVKDAPAPPPPLVNPAPPALINLNLNAFKALTPPPDGLVAPPVDPLQLQTSNRLLFATIQMGDYFFQTGRFGEALRNYQFAQMLAPDNLDVQLRIQQTLAFTPPPNVYAKPRIVVMPFVTVGNPVIVPPYLNYGTPTYLAPYFSWRYDVADPSLIYWYMGRMGLSMNDLMNDPNARRWLGRAAGVRYFVFGNHIQSAQTTGFAVNTYLIDSESGYQQGIARITVQNPWELKLRLPELAQLTMMSPADQLAYLAQQQQNAFFQFMDKGRRHTYEGRFREAVGDFQQALAIYPDNVQAQVYLLNAQAQAVFQDWQLARQQQYVAQQAAIAAYQQRQMQLALSADQARQRAIAQAAARSDADQQAHLRFRFEARGNLAAQAQIALNAGNFSLSLTFFQGASSLNPPVSPNFPAPTPINPQAIAQARQGVQQAQQLRIAAFTAGRDSALLKVRDQQLAAAQKQLATERASTQAQIDAAVAAQTKRDEAAYLAARAKGLALFAKNNYDAALAAFQSAQRLKQTDEIHNLIDKTLESKTATLPKAKQDELLAARKASEAAKAAAKQKELNYDTALKAAQAALAAKNYESAQAKFQEAGQLFKTDAVTAGLQQIAATKTALAADSKRKEQLQTLIATGQTALKLKDYDAADKAFRSASQLDPTNPAIAQGLKDSAAGRTTAGNDKQRLADFQTALTLGQKALTGKDYKGAIQSFRQALKLMPNDASATKLLQQAQLAAGQADKTAAGFQQAMNAGQKALATKNYKAAVAAFTSAAKLNPNDPSALKLLQQSQQALADANQQVALASYQKAMTAGQNALTLKQYDTAVTAFKDALKWAPGDQKATAQLQQAQQALADSAKVKAPPVDPAKAFNDAVQRAAAAEKAFKYADAAKAYQEALKLRPNDQNALAGWKKNDYSAHLVQGQQYLDTMMWMAAQNEFEAALRIFPGAPQATKLLQKAKNKMK